MTDDWGPWIEHDGLFPTHLANMPAGTVVELVYSGQGQKTDGKGIGTGFPGWYWRKRLVWIGWLTFEERLVCATAGYAPIIRYRMRKPRALAQIKGWLVNLPERVDA
jgi:hypothetical protein